MNLDLLISKYIDGELNLEEDKELRSKIADNFDAKQDFDAAIFLHSALKADAESIKAPEKLVGDTKDIIMMKVLAREPIKLHKEKKTRQFYSVAAAVSFFLVMNFVKLSDLNDFQNQRLADNKQNSSTAINLVSDNQNNESGNTIANHSSSSANTYSRKINKSYNKHYNSTISDDDQVINQTPVVSNILEDDNKLNDRCIVNFIPGDEIANSNHSAVSSLSSTHSNVGEKLNKMAPKDLDNEYYNVNNTKQNSNNALMDNSVGFSRGKQFDIGLSEFALNNANVEMTTFLSTNFVNSGFAKTKDNAISVFSQSVAYGFTKSSKIGVEVGYLGFKYNENVSLRVPLVVNSPILNGNTNGITPSGDNGISNPNPGNTQSGSSNYSNSGGNSSNYTTVPFNINRKCQLFWGAAFYEHTFDVTNYLSINGRLGIGATSEGFVGYTRAFAKLKVYSGFSVTLGADAMLFNADLPRNNSSNNTKALGNLIYGLQFDL